MTGCFQLDKLIGAYSVILHVGKDLWEKYPDPQKWDLCRWETSNQNSMWAECGSGLYMLYTAYMSLAFLLLQADCLKTPSSLSADNLLPDNNQQKTNIALGSAVDSKQPTGTAQGQPAARLFVYFGWHFPLSRICSLLFSTYSPAHILSV